MVELQRRPITVPEYHRMLEVGILTEGERIELLRGDLVRKVTIGDRHRACVNRLTRMLVLKFEGRAAVQVQNPVVVLEDSEPEPDIALLAINEGSVGGSRHAYSADVYALIDVTDSSRGRELQYKVQLYAEAGIQEYWVVDLIDGVVRAHRDPEPSTRRYRTTYVMRPGDELAFQAFPDVALSVSEIVGNQ